MTLHVNDGGTWKQILNVYVNDAGTWKEVQEVYVNDAGVWKSVHVNDVVSIDDVSVHGVFTFGPATVAYTLGNDGLIYRVDQDGTSSVGAWITPQSNMANYECFATLNSGDTPSGTFGAWQSLSSNRSWSLTRLSNAAGSSTLQVQVRRASDGTVLDSATISLQITRSA